jgi:hypothetical protein
VKGIRLFQLSLLAVSLLTVCLGIAFAQPQHGFSVKQYHEFHEVLHPLQHEALPKGDFGTIRAQSGVLLKHGRSIVKLGVPKGTQSEKVPTFKKELKKFDKALAKFGSDVKSGSDEQLKKSYSAVHDSFETLADMLP